MLSIVWSWVVSLFEKLLKEKNYKAIIILLIVFFLGNTVVLNNKISVLTENVNLIKTQVPELNRLSEERVYSYINKLNYDAIELFTGYASNNAEDLQTIIDKTSVTADNGFLLKKLIEKSKNDILHEIKKTQYKQRYLPDSLKIEVRKLSYLNSDTAYFPLYVRQN